jgi:hypothetical protein
MAPISTVDTLEEIGRLLALATDEVARQPGDTTSILTYLITAHKLSLTERAKLAGVQRAAVLMAQPLATETMQ